MGKLNKILRSFKPLPKLPNQQYPTPVEVNYKQWSYVGLKSRGFMASYEETQQLSKYHQRTNRVFIEAHFWDE